MNLIGNSFSFLIFLKRRLFNEYFPLHVAFNLTNKCNLKCAYCFGKFYERNDEELTTEQVFLLIGELAKMGTKRIGISGGEALLRPDLPQIIKFIQDKKIECGLNSNGILIPAKINEIKFVNSICLSLDGPQEIHDYYRGKGSWQAAMRAIETVKKYNIPLHVSAVLTKGNYNYIDWLLKKAKELKFLIQFPLLQNQFYGEKNSKFSEMMLSKEEYIQTIKKIIDYRDKGYPIFFSKKSYLDLLSWPDYRQDRMMGKDPDFKHTKCWAGKYMCSIEANGDIYPCGYFEGHKVFNFKTHGFKKCFENINHHDCYACSWICHNESNSVFNLDTSVLLSQFKNYLFEQKNNKKL